MVTRAQGKRRWMTVMVLGFGLLALLAGETVSVSEGAPTATDKKVGKASTQTGPLVLPKTGALPAQLDFDWNPIAFDNGVPVGGRMHLTLRRDGSYVFTGHFHDSGFTSYNFVLAYVVKDPQNRAYTFTHKGHVRGTLEGGSRDHDWKVEGKNPAIAHNWASLAESRSYGEARTDLDIDPILNAFKVTLKVVVQVFTIVGETLLEAA
jgi:hypothetical protein